MPAIDPPVAQIQNIEKAEVFNLTVRLVTVAVSDLTTPPPTEGQLYPRGLPAKTPSS
jgi:hypothetical protein